MAPAAAPSAPVYEYKEPYRAEAKPAGSAVFAWPVNGKLISGFGTTAGGERRRL